MTLLKREKMRYKKKIQRGLQALQNQKYTLPRVPVKPFISRMLLIIGGIILIGMALFFLNAIQKKPAISVILPTYNRADLLPQALDSILHQTFPDFELIVINDASQDETATLLKQYAKKDKRIRILTNKENKGIAVSLNRGLDKARGIYIARMDDDDISLPDRFQKQKEFLDKHPEITVVGSAYELFENGAIVQMESEPARNQILAYFQVPVFHPATMIRHDFLKRHNIRYESAYESAEDTPFWYQIIQKGGRITNLKDTLIKRRFYSSKKEGYYERQAASFLAFLHKTLGDCGARYVQFPMIDIELCFLLNNMKEKNKVSQTVDSKALEDLAGRYCAKISQPFMAVQHAYWKDFLIPSTNGEFCRHSILEECGHIINQTENSFTFKWNNWETETFIKHPDGGYHLQAP